MCFGCLGGFGFGCYGICASDRLRVIFIFPALGLWLIGLIYWLGFAPSHQKLAFAEFLRKMARLSLSGREGFWANPKP